MFYVEWHVVVLNKVIFQYKPIMFLNILSLNINTILITLLDVSKFEECPNRFVDILILSLPKVSCDDMLCFVNDFSAKMIFQYVFLPIYLENMFWCCFHSFLLCHLSMWFYAVI